LNFLILLKLFISNQNDIRFYLLLLYIT
jgi:hypothetical protein